MNRAQGRAMAALAALSLWSLAFLFGVVTERMNGRCERSAATALAAEDGGRR
jgi:hypothetical protein